MGSHYVTIYYVACKQLTRDRVDLRMVIYWPKHVVLSIVVLNTFDNKALCLTVHNICQNYQSEERCGSALSSQTDSEHEMCVQNVHPQPGRGWSARPSLA